MATILLKQLSFWHHSVEENVFTKFFWAVFISIFSFSYLYAADFVVGNISYDVVSMTDLTCEVAPGTIPYNGELNIPATVTFKNRTFSVIGIGNWACKSKSITKLTLPEGLQYIGEDAFDGNDLEKIVIPSTVTTIKSGAFYWNHVTVVQTSSISWKTVYQPIELIITDSDEELVGYKDDLLGYMPFCECNLEKIYIGRNINKNLIADQIGTLTKVIEIGDKVKEITTEHFNDNMFKDLNSLEKVIIGKGLRLVPYFDEGDYLKEVYVKTTEPQSSEGFNDATYMNAILYVPEGCKAIYEQTAPWSNFWEIKEWNGITGIKNTKVVSHPDAGYTYDINGHRVNSSRKGVIIKNGKKFIKK